MTRQSFPPVHLFGGTISAQSLTEVLRSTPPIRAVVTQDVLADPVPRPTNFGEVMTSEEEIADRLIAEEATDKILEDIDAIAQIMLTGYMPKPQ